MYSQTAAAGLFFIFKSTVHLKSFRCILYSEVFPNLGCIAMDDHDAYAPVRSSQIYYIYSQTAAVFFIFSPLGLDILTEFTIIFIVTVYFCISMSGE